MNVVRWIWFGLGLLGAFKGEPIEVTIGCFIMSELFQVQIMLKEDKNDKEN